MIEISVCCGGMGKPFQKLINSKHFNLAVFYRRMSSVLTLMCGDVCVPKKNGVLQLNWISEES